MEDPTAPGHRVPAAVGDETGSARARPPRRTPARDGSKSLGGEPARSATRSRPVERRGLGGARDGAPEMVLTGPILIFSKTTDYRHESIPSGVRALEALGRKLGLKPVTTERDVARRELHALGARVPPQPLADQHLSQVMAHLLDDGGALRLGDLAKELGWPLVEVRVLEPALVHGDEVEPVLHRREPAAHASTARRGGGRACARHERE